MCDVRCAIIVNNAIGMPVITMDDFLDTGDRKQ